MLKQCILFFSIFLTACSTMSSKDNSKEEARLVSTAKINTQLGLAYLERNNVMRAKQKLLAALKQAPTIPEPWYSMGYFMEVTGDREEAQQYYLKAIALAPNRGDTHNNYGTYLCRSGDYQQSIQEFLRATQDSNYLNSAEAYENAGLCALKIPNKVEAKQFFVKAVAQDPTRLTSANELKALG